ncbi:MAG TPA: argininosuccinate lyase, partial [Oscillospiraceae bacterium]|nr:argininosuccinate lyase [Oscillospiraceae bacterium]
MAKLWSGRLHSGLDAAAEDFNASIRVDARMVREDIEGSVAHAAMLGACGILTPEDAALIRKTLNEIRAEIEAGTLAVDPAAEDVHTFVEQELTARIGEAGKRLHTARSRNDQVATDFRMHLRGEIAGVRELAKKLVAALCDKAEVYADAILPGYTHLQRAQPVSFGHHLMAYAFMLRRDCSRLSDCARRMNESPLGSGALAGTTFPIDRAITAGLLGFDAPCRNSMDGVSDRDFAVELLSALSILMMHLSRFSEEIILW